MYHKVDGEWVAMADATAVRNGGFEENINAAFGVDPTNVKAENKAKAVKLSWQNPANQQIKIYNGSQLVATTEEGASSYTISGLEANKEYLFTLKGVGTISESTGVTISALPFDNLPDTINTISGVEVFKEGAAHWLTGYQSGNSSLYLTHDAYEGSAALLVNATSVGAPANCNLDKTNANADKDKLIAGDTYKIELYEKPVSSNGTYKLIRSARYYDDYDVFDFNMYDAETGNAISANDTIEDKWYRLEREFTANSGSISSGVGLSMWGEGTFILDSVKMYHKVDGEWIAMADATAVRNGGFEEEVIPDTTAPYDVENFKAITGDGKAELSWDAVDEADLAGYKLFMNGNEIADMARNVTSYTAEELANDTEYTFIIKSYDRIGNVAEGSEIKVIPTAPAYTVGNFVMGSNVVEGENEVAINIVNVKVEEGVNAQLIIGLYNGRGALVKAVASEETNISIGNNKTLSAKIVVDDINADDYKIKAFCWKSIDSLSSLREAQEISE